VIALLAKQKSENDSIKEKLIKSRKEEERCKQDYLKAEAKYNLFKDCDEKLQLLSDENKRL
jgi:predicted phage gp36 major capsid-like protein